MRPLTLKQVKNDYPDFDNDTTKIIKYKKDIMKITSLILGKTRKIFYRFNESGNLWEKFNK